MQNNNVCFCSLHLISLGSEPGPGKFVIGPLFWCVALGQPVTQMVLPIFMHLSPDFSLRTHCERFAQVFIQGPIWILQPLLL